MQNNDQRQIASAIIIAGLIIAGAVLLKDTRGSVVEKKEAAPAVNAKDLSDRVVKPVTNKDHIVGNINAKIVIVEYSDIECPFCKVFHATMHKLVKERNDTAWVYRHYPIPQLHSKSSHEAEATECAYEQGGNTTFWKYIDRLFEITPSNNGLDEKELSNTAEYLNLNTSSFYTCLTSGKYKDLIQKYTDEGIKAKVNGTPTSYILVNGKVIDTIPGAQPYEEVVKRLNAIK